MEIIIINMDCMKNESASDDSIRRKNVISELLYFVNVR